MNRYKKIVENFLIDGELVEVKPFGSGHINETLLVSINNYSQLEKYILRKINNNVFKDPEIVILNTVNTIDHLRSKMQELGASKFDHKKMKMIKTFDFKYYFRDSKGSYWCLFDFIDDAYTVDFVQNKEKAYEAAKAFGRFQKFMIDADINDYQESIPDFHNLEKRLFDFDKALKSDPVDRVNKASEEIRKIAEYRYLSNNIKQMVENKILPTRITHNDTKINNIMFNKKTDKGQCVIDLDTVMPGTVLFDFGDMVRTSTSPVKEDETDISKVTMRLEIFESLLKGYLEELVDELEDTEINNLVYGAKVIIYEQAVRFLTDYIMDDVYYSTEYPDHNWVRTKTQLALLDSMMKQNNEIERIANRITDFEKMHKLT